MIEAPTKRLLIATHNAGKLHEFKQLLSPLGWQVVSSGELGLSEPEETGLTFEANALLKAHAGARASQLMTLADDSGLCVTALGGKPGIYSARWAGPTKDFTKAMTRIQNELGDQKDRSASFICVLALAWPDGRAHTIEGRVEGMLSYTLRGTYGHGYDPLFIPQGQKKTFAEMSNFEKNRLSHRGIAARKMVATFFTERPL